MAGQFWIVNLFTKTQGDAVSPRHQGVFISTFQEKIEGPVWDPIVISFWLWNMGGDLIFINRPRGKLGQLSSWDKQLQVDV